MSLEISDEFISHARIAPVDALFHLCEHIQGMVSENHGWTQDEFEDLTVAVAFVASMVEGGLLENLLHPPSMTGNVPEDCSTLKRYLDQYEEIYRTKASKQRLSSLTSRFSAALGNTFAYHFTDGDVARIQTLINELRELVSQSDGFEADHKARLLKRLERLQSEIHKSVSDLDRFWGLIGDAGVVLGKLGTNAKPLVDRIKEIADIVWRTQSITEQLPSGTPPPLLRESSSESQD
ncbi:hypothetical protein WJ23_33135 [Burkholderia lata]|uniref:hypothetical protein n=1 Tax=Burkholderia lata (strain ATCC 17760 / DSM 23089 / LMG 22485 / NCIMB 9086 / R18194 / 383) TaxID=482957 RepID=UPI0008422193|nr:hypothetical protein [Burkholderia lata]AOJ42681.1 hypothetical protein WJ23_33135 [Burkholderia lata]